VFYGGDRNLPGYPNADVDIDILEAAKEEARFVGDSCLSLDLVTAWHTLHIEAGIH
jgi:hypothetical protein